MHTLCVDVLEQPGCFVRTQLDDLSMLWTGDFAALFWAAHNAPQLLIHIEQDEKNDAHDSQCLCLLCQLVETVCIPIFCHALGRWQQDGLDECSVCVIEHMPQDVLGTEIHSLLE